MLIVAWDEILMELFQELKIIELEFNILACKQLLRLKLKSHFHLHTS